MNRTNGSLAYQDPLQEELIGGKLVMMAPPLTNHNFISGNIYMMLREFLKGKRCKPFGDGTLVCLTEEDHFIPDAMVVCDPDKIKYNGVYGAPDLVVEILSHSTAKYDLGYKKDIYERCGVREYWIVNPGSKSVSQYVLTDGKFELREVCTLLPDYMLADMSEEERAEVKSSFPSVVLDGLAVQLALVFEDVI